MNKKIALISNTSWSVYNFRLGLIKKMLDIGYNVTVLAPVDDYSEKIESLGCEFIDIKLSRKGVNPVNELKVINYLYKVLRKGNFDVVIPYTVKPVIYINLISFFKLRYKIISVITGLGYVFMSRGIISVITKKLYKIVLNNSNKVWFLNKDDKKIFMKNRLISNSKSEILNSEGINLNLYLQKEYSNKNIVFLMIGRILWDKGIREYFEMAEYIKDKYPNIEFQLLGSLDDNPSSVPKEYLDKYINNGTINHLGFVDGVESIIANSSCVILPSYREGVPRSLLEAMAVGRPIITTNSVGCKETVDDNVNGFLCKPRSTKDLIDKIERFISLSFDERKNMGLKGRIKAEKEFDENIVIRKYINTIKYL